jgi:putative membrane protein
MIGTSIGSALARWFRTPRAALGAVGLALVAMVAGTLLVGAYWNPPGNTANLTAAVVNEDSPVTVNEQTVSAGADVAAQLLADPSLTWTETSMADAQQGLDRGSLALVIRIPSDFSANIASLDSGDPSQATISAYSNDATNYLAGEVAASAISSLERKISADVSLNFINEVYSALPQAREQGESAVAQSKAVAEGVQAASASAQQVAASTAQVAEGSAAVAKSAQDVSALSATISTGSKSIDANLATLQQQLTSKNQPELAASVAAIRTNYATVVTKPATDLSSQSAALATQTRQLGTEAEAINTSMAQASAQLTELAATSKTAAEGAAGLSTQLTDTLLPQAVELNQGLTNAASKVPPVSDEQREAFTTVLAQPINIQQETQNRVDYMGEGFAPIFVSTALFLGAMLIWLLLRPLNQRLLDFGFPAWQAVLTRWVPGFVWACLQVLLLVLGLVVIGVKAAAWAPLIGVVLLSAACFLSMVQLIKAMLGGGGHMVALAVLLVQVSAAAGTFPVQTLGGFFRFLHPLMPMTYSVDAMRRSIAGGPLTPYLWQDAAVLLAVTILCVGLTTVVAARKRTASAAAMEPALTLG